MKKKRFFQSTIVRVVTIIIALVLPINIMTIVLSGSALKSNREQMAKEFQDTLSVRTDILTTTISRASKKLIYLSFDEQDFLELSDQIQSKSEKARLVVKLKKELDRVLLDYDWIDMMFVRSANNDLTLTVGYPGISHMKCKELIIQESDAISASGEGKLFGWVWKCETIDDVPVLLGIRQWNGLSQGCIINLERLLVKMNLVDSGGGRTVFFTNKARNISTQEGEACLTKIGMSLEELEQNNKYSVFYSDLSKYDLCLVEVVDWNVQNRNLPAVIVWMQLLSVALTILVIPILILCIRRWVNRPLVELTKAMDEIEKGNLGYRISAKKTHSREFDQINQNFNKMMEQVTDLRIDVYEKELAQKNIKMQYLSQQIQPHFILNAMNVLYSYEPEEYELSQKMIKCISKYFRHIVYANDTFVELYQEMEHIQNYFEIQKARFPDMFFAIVEYDEALKTVLIPPLLIQNFTENAIKHSLKIGKKIEIFVIGEKITKDGQDWMRIRIADTGEGISDEALEQIEEFRRTGIAQPKLGVGIQNAIERMKYLYLDNGSIHIERDPHYSGTNIELIVPVKYPKEGEIYDETFFDRRRNCST